MPNHPTDEDPQTMKGALLNIRAVVVGQEVGELTFTVRQWWEEELLQLESRTVHLPLLFLQPQHHHRLLVPSTPEEDAVVV